MAISNFPAALQGIIQENFLEREFKEGLESRLTYRAVADREEIAVGVGETVSKTRPGLKAPVTTPMDPSTNTNLDNGLTPSGWAMERFTMTMNMYSDTQDLNIVTQNVGIQKQFLHNAKVNGIQAAQSLDRLARNALFAAHMGGNTRVTATLGAPATTIEVDDIRGFETVLSNGVMVAVSGSSPMTVLVGDNDYSLVGSSADLVNTSSMASFGGKSGTLTFSGNVSVADATAGNSVISSVAPAVVRPASKGNTSELLATDLLTMNLILAAKAKLLDNNVPMVGSAYNCYLDHNQMLELFQDGDFKLLYRGAYGSQEYRNGEVVELLGVRFITTTESIQQALGGVKIRRAIMCGQGAIIEGDFAGIAETVGGGVDPAQMNIVDGIVQITREPLDRLQQIIAQSWYWIGSFCCPTDQTANANIIPTATNAYYKRAVVIETA